MSSRVCEKIKLICVLCLFLIDLPAFQRCLHKRCRVFFLINCVPVDSAALGGDERLRRSAVVKRRHNDTQRLRCDFYLRANARHATDWG